MIIDFDESIIEYPNIKRYPGGASNDLMPNLQHPENPLPLIDLGHPNRVEEGGGGLELDGADLVVKTTAMTSSGGRGLVSGFRHANATNNNATR